ncbi:MAG TPA: hypothetical protein VHH88_11620 [Verrucomicrobiae bacterium]|nr:hypothetical protein [Verrucomicrobiae bacterium]
MESTFAKMTASSFRVRRATLDDIAQLSNLWKSMGFPVENLGRRITEFQVVENAEGEIIGAAGLEIAQKQGRIHSEGFTDFSHADQARPLLWERIHAVARNHGLLRLWTRETAPFWSHSGMVKAEADAFEKLPEVWKNEPGDWLTLKLREELESIISADHEFALFMDAEKQRTKRTLQQARLLKSLATLIALALLALIILAGFLILRKNPGLLHR